MTSLPIPASTLFLIYFNLRRALLVMAGIRSMVLKKLVIVYIY